MEKDNKNPKSKKETKEKPELPSSIRKRIEELIQQNVLSHGIKKGIDALSKDINQNGKKITKKTLAEILPDFIWTKENLKLLRELLALGAPLERLCESLNFLSESIISKKVKELRGVRPKVSKGKEPKTFEAGFGKLLSTDEIKKMKSVVLKKYSFKNPFQIPVKDPENFRISFLNAPHIGLAYNPILEQNITRNFFREAERRKDDAVVITGGFFSVDSKKSSGFLTTHRALYSGMDFDPDVLPQHYKEEAKNINRFNPPDKVTFVTLGERVDNLLNGWKKITCKKDGTPIFQNKIYFCFGSAEEEIIESSAHAHILYITTVMRNEVMVERKMNEAVLAHKLAKNGDKENEETRKLRELIRELLEKEKRMIQTNVSERDRKRFVDYIRSALILWLKDSIPNSEFITQGPAFCQIGNKKLEIKQTSGTTIKPSAPLDAFMKKAGQRGLDKKLSDVVVVAGPYNVYAGSGVIEFTKNNESKTSQIWELPVAIDNQFLQIAASQIIRKSSPIEKLFRNPMFEPGIFHLGYANDVWVPEVSSISFLREHRPESIPSKDISEYIYILLESDNHYGQRSQIHVIDGRTGIPIPIDLAFSEMMMRSYTEKGKRVPFHMFVNAGDDAQGHHFETQQNQHPKAKSHADIERFVLDVVSKSKNSKDINIVRDLVKSLASELLEQMHVKGIDYPILQLEYFIEYAIKRRIALFSEILKNSQDAKLSIRGIREVREHKKGVKDSRDIGVITFIGGDHFEKTTDFELTEGKIFQQVLIAYLSSDQSLNFSNEKLSELIRAPLSGNVPIGYGIVSTPKGYEWGLVTRHKLTKKIGQNGQRLSNSLWNLSERGDYPGIFSGTHFIQLSGDIHFFGSAFGRQKTLISSASCTEADSYGDFLGFRQSNLGITVVGIPAKGPDFGPLRVITFPHDFIRAYMLDPWEIDWSSIFIDPIR